ncbi:MAG: PAS domain S-box protein [Dehalococcoidia bacterium]
MAKTRTSPGRSQSVDSEPRKRKQYKNQTALVLRILECLSQDGNQRELIGQILQLAKEFSGCEAAGIRLREGEDFPYYQTAGFPDEFVLAETSLCIRDPNGRLIRDDIGNPVIECMCGNVICGRFDPKKPFFTRSGSFWTNSTTELLASTTEEDRQARTRDRCNGEGYESVALIPLGFQGDNIGLLQLNDRRRNRFTPELIEFYEGVGHSIGIILARKLAEDSLKEYQDHLQELVETRTAQLRDVNERLRNHISRRKKVEESLWDSEARFRTLSDATFEGIGVAEQGVFVDANQQFADMFGYDLMSMPGMEVSKLVAPEDQDLVKGRILSGSEETYQHRAVRGDGTVFFVEVRPRMTTVDGRTVRVTAVRDITERRQVEEALQEAELRYRTVADFTYDWEYWVGPDGTLLYVSPSCERVTGYATRDFIAKRTLLEEIILPEDRKTWDRHRCDARGEPAPQGIQFRIRRRDGEIRWVEHACQPVADDEGISMGVRASNRDISDRKQAEVQLRTSLEEKELLLRELHHRVKNNLQIVSSLLYLQSQYVKDKRTLATLEEGQNRVKAMALVHDLLHQSEHISNIDIAQYVQNLTAHLFRSYGVDRNLITLVTSVDVASMDIDTAIPCGLIISELVSNSLRHAFPADRPCRDRKAEVNIGLCRVDDSTVTLSVRDNGVGFPEELDFRNTLSLGMRLVAILTRQLQATVELDRTNGTAVSITFGTAQSVERSQSDDESADPNS